MHPADVAVFSSLFYQAGISRRMAGLLHRQPHCICHTSTLRQSPRSTFKEVKISLIISTFDQPISLGKVLRGLERQTRWPDEVFITDDGSGDETRQLIEQWKQNARVPVHHVWHPHDGFRKVILLNKAVAAATGDYLVFTDEI